MSLINEALKKAQRTRSGDAAEAAPPMPGGGPTPRRGKSQGPNATILIGAGALVLVVLSVVGTVLLLSGPDTPPPPAAKSTPVAVASTPPASTPISVVLPPAAQTTPTIANTAVPESASATTPGMSSAQPKASETGPTTSAPAGGGSLSELAKRPSEPAVSPSATPATATAATTPTPPPAPSSARPDERVHAFIDAIRVAGIRASGNESRVLMNDRVYRVNDLVERTLGVRLKAVGTDTLTFVDANGVEYVKTF